MAKELKEEEESSELLSLWSSGLRFRGPTRMLSKRFSNTSRFVVSSKVWMNTIPTRDCDILMTFPTKTDDATLMWLLARLRARTPQLCVHVRYHSNTGVYGFYLTASYENLLRGAEDITLHKHIRSEYGGGLKEFVFEDQEYFEGVEDSTTFLNSQERQSIVKNMLFNLRATESDQLRNIRFLDGQALVPLLISKGVIKQVLPLHNSEDLDYLKKNWVQAFFSKQPLEKICDYFGVKIAIYFAYLGHYTKSLTFPAFVGFVFWIMSSKNQYVEDIIFVVFALINIIWSTLYLESWKRRSSEYAYQWGTLDKEDELLVEARPLFSGSLVKSKVTGKLQPYYPSWKRNLFRYFVTCPVVFACLSLVFYVMLMIFQLQDWINMNIKKGEFPFFFKFLPKILLAVCIGVMDDIYKKIAFWLNDKENYRLDETYENQLIIKLASFQFVNSFLSLFYIAFYLQDMDRLQDQLAAIFITRQVIGNIKEAIIPYIIEKLKLYKIGYEMTAAMSPDTLERQMREMTGIDTRDSSQEKSDTESDSAQIGTSEDLMDPISVKGSCSETKNGGTEQLSSEDTKTEEAKLPEIKEVSPAREASAGKEPAEGQDADSKDSSVNDAVAESSKESSPDRERIAEEEKSAEKEISSDRERSLSREKTPSQDSSGESESQEEELLLQNVTLDNGKLATSGPTLTQAEVEACMKKYEDTFEDHLEMLVQFGYVTLFSSAFPMAALCALLNNVIEIRSDAFKLCMTFQRPFGQQVQSIGTWQDALEFMSVIAVMVNCALVGFSGLADRLWPDMTTTERIVFIVILEHVILFLKFALAYAIPDVPMWVTEKKARLEFLRREALKKLESKTPGSMPNSPASSGISKPQSTGYTSTTTSHPNSAPSKRTAHPPTSLSTHAEMRNSASSHTSPQTYDTIVEDPQLVQTRITTSYSSAPRIGPQSKTNHLTQRNLGTGNCITGPADLGSGATGMRRSSSGTSVDPPESYAKKEL